MCQPHDRKTLRNLITNFTTSNKENKGNYLDLDEKNYQTLKILNIQDLRVLDDFKYAPMRFARIYSGCLNLFN